MFINKEEYEKRFNEKWPIKKHEKCEIQNINHSIVLIIKNKKYALNGLAQTVLKLKTPHEKKIVDIGVSTYSLLKIGIDLW